MAGSLVLLAIGFVSGLTGRHRPTAFRFLFRGQLILLSSTTTFLAGWIVRWDTKLVASAGVVSAGELTALALAVCWLRAGAHPVSVASFSSNSGFWSIPVAGALFGPQGAGFAAAYDAIAPLRSFPAITILRRRAPAAPPVRTALIDYLPQLALLIGVLLRMVAAPPDLAGWITGLGSVIGVTGFLLLGMAMPSRFPTQSDFVDALPAIALRFGVTSAVCAAASLAGFDLAGPAWVLAFAPSPFAIVSFASLYGYRRERAAAIAVLSVPTAAMLLPVVSALGH